MIQHGKQRSFPWHPAFHYETITAVMIFALLLARRQIAPSISLEEAVKSKSAKDFHVILAVGKAWEAAGGQRTCSDGAWNRRV